MNVLIIAEVGVSHHEYPYENFDNGISSMKRFKVLDKEAVLDFKEDELIEL